MKHLTLCTPPRIATVCFLVCASAICAMAGPVSTGLPDTVDPRAWHELDIVPMPKEIRLTDDDLMLDPTRVVLVIGREPAEQSAFGAEWINKRLADHGGEPLSLHAEGDSVPAGRTRIVIGTTDDNALVAAAVREGLVDVGPGNPGPRGYEIRRSADGAVVYLAGADAIGALYACVTLGELLGKAGGGPPRWRAAEVRDWPDFQYLGTCYRAGPGRPFWKSSMETEAEARAAWFERLRAEYGWMLRRKESLLRWSIPPSPKEGGRLPRMRTMRPSQFEALRAGVDLGRRYGIRAHSYCFSMPYPGLKADFPDAGDEHEMQGSRFDSPRRFDRRSLWWRSWSLPDEFARRTAAESADYARRLGFTDVAFHDTDTGGADNPAEWERRSLADHQRWGDDYTAATIHRHRIYFEEFTKRVPDIRMHFTLYPYAITYFDPSRAPGSSNDRRRLELLSQEQAAAKADVWRRRYADFWSRLDRAFPPGQVYFAIRENTPAAFDGYRAIMSPGRPVFHWYGVRTLDLYPDMFIAGFRCSPNDYFFDFRTAHKDGVDVVPLRRLVSREYTWNLSLPGLRTLEPDEQGNLRPTVSDPAGPNYTVVMPRLVRNLFGRALADDIAEALAHPVHAPWLFYHQALVFDCAEPRQVNLYAKAPEYYRHFPPETEAIEREERSAAHASRAMDRAWEKLGSSGSRLGLDDLTLQRVMFLREYMHSCRWVAAIGRDVHAAMVAAEAGGSREAVAALKRARAKHRWARKALAGLVAERPPELREFGHLYCAATTLAMLGGSGKGFFLNAAVDRVKNRLAQAAVPRDIMKELEKRRVIESLRVTRPLPPARLPLEKAWRGARPIETLFALGEGLLADAAPTRVLLMHDDRRLYFRARARLPQGRTGVDENERIEMYLDARDAGGEAVMLVARAGGQVSLHALRDGTWDPITKPEAVWTPKRSKADWHGAGSLPFKTLGTAPSGAWRFALLRSHVTSVGQEYSSTLVTAAGQNPNFLWNKHEAFLPIRWTEQAFEPEVRLEVVGLQVRPITLDDGIAARVRFGIKVESDVELDNVILWVEARDARGRTLARKRLAKRPRILYRWRPEETFEFNVLKGGMEGAPHLILESNQGVFKNPSPALLRQDAR